MNLREHPDYDDFDRLRLGTKAPVGWGMSKISKCRLCGRKGALMPYGSIGPLQDDETLFTVVHGGIWTQLYRSFIEGGVRGLGVRDQCDYWVRPSGAIEEIAA